MFNIDRGKMDTYTKLGGAKTNSCKTNEGLMKYFKNNIWNVIDKVGEFSIYEMAHWNSNIDRWLGNRNYLNTKSYKRGQIVLVDLGATNFRYEPSFTHPCIILEARQRSILVVPCSTKKFGKGYREIIDAYAATDGFSMDTGIQVEEYRWINKNRIISKLGKTGSRVLNEIDKHLLNSIPTYRMQLAKFDAETQENNRLKEDNEALKEDNEALNDKINELELNIKELNEKINVLKQENAE